MERKTSGFAEMAAPLNLLGGRDMSGAEAGVEHQATVTVLVGFDVFI